MSNGKLWSEDDIKLMLSLKEKGASFAAIAAAVNRTVAAVKTKLCFLSQAAAQKQQPLPEQERNLVKVPRLSDFSPRQMIKHLYDLGYRIEDNRIVFIKKEYVNIKSIIND